MSIKINKKRQELIQLSKAAQQMIKMGIFDGTVNECIVQCYKDTDSNISDFKTFNEWKKEGFKILKGSKSYTVWGSPIKGKHKTEGKEIAPDIKTEDGETKYKYFPICNLFANTQVEKIN